MKGGFIMYKKKIFVSFDYEDDKDYRNLLKAWSANKNVDFVFNDVTPNEIQSWNIPTIKAGLTNKVKDCTYLMVIAGDNINKRHRDSINIGHVNWINFEVSKAMENNKRIIVVKLKINNQLPDVLRYKPYPRQVVPGFSQQGIMNALQSW